MKKLLTESHRDENKYYFVKEISSSKRIFMEPDDSSGLFIVFEEFDKEKNSQQK